MGRLDRFAEAEERQRSLPVETGRDRVELELPGDRPPRAGSCPVGFAMNGRRTLRRTGCDTGPLGSAVEVRSRPRPIRSDLGDPMDQLPDTTLARGVDLLHQLRAALPDRGAEYIGRLSEHDPLAVVEAFLYVRRSRAKIPATLYQDLREQMIEVLEAV